MKKFFEAVKIELGSDISKYFRDVEVESIKTTKKRDTLKFNLVAKDIIPYDVLIQAKNEITNELFKSYGSNEVKKKQAEDFVKIVVKIIKN